MVQTGLLAPDIEMTLYQTHFPVSARPLSLSAPLSIFPGPPDQCGALGEAIPLTYWWLSEENWTVLCQKGDRAKIRKSKQEFKNLRIKQMRAPLLGPVKSAVAASLTGCHRRSCYLCMGSA